MNSIEVFRKILYPLGSGFFLFSCIGIFLWGISVRNSKILFFSRYVSLSIVLFVISIMVSGIVNLENMLTLEWQTVLGLNRFLMGLLLVIVQFFISTYIYNVWLNSEYIHTLFIRCLLYGFLISAIVGVIEVISMFSILDASYVLSVIDFLYRGELGRQAFRVSSVAGEPSFYAIYLGFVAPFLLYEYYKRGSMIILFGINLFLLMILGTYSRTAYGIVLLEFLIFIIFFFKEIFRAKLKYTRNLVVIEALIIVIVVKCFSIDFIGDILGVFYTLMGDNAWAQMSNLTRLGSSIAALNIFYDNILLGIGYDQFAYFASYYYPDWAYKSMEIQNLSVNYTSRSFWPSVYNYYARLLCEVGIIGFFSFVLLIISISRETCKALMLLNNDRIKVLFISFLASCLSMLSGSDLPDVFCLSFALLLAEIKLSAI